jgi:phospholipid/cholesterol/gamma-HCH transport system permease protein
MSKTPTLTSTLDGDRLRIIANGSWTASYIDVIERAVEAAALQTTRARATSMDLTAVEELDTAGAWLLERLLRSGSEQGRKAEVTGTPAHFRGLFEEVRQVNRTPPVRRKPPYAIVAALNAVGRTAVSVKSSANTFLEMFGAIGAAMLRIATRPQTFRLTSAVHHVFRVGWQALPIVLLITFLIGCIIAQQGFFHFRKFGADAYVVDMVGILVLREIGVLIVAIMVAGRSGSAYTAELGSMKMREEIDALRTMGFDPVEVLIVPRLIALIIALPILTFAGALSALYGGGLVAWFYGDMNPAIYIARLHEAVSVTHFQVGMIKAPFMALVIGVVAASEGLKVKGSAESLGLQTTTSVVKSIFLVIVLDGVFAMFFASIGM